MATTISGNHSPEGLERGTKNVVFNTLFPNGENTDMTVSSLDIPITEDELLCSRKEAAELGEISAQTLINYRNHGIVFSTQKWQKSALLGKRYQVAALSPKEDPCQH